MKTLETLYALDVDRTLLDTRKVTGPLYRVIHEFGIASEAELVAVQNEVQASGGSFDVMGYLRELGVDSSGVEEIREAFVGLPNGEVMLYPDALPLLDRTSGESILVTYGGADWQVAKIRAVGLAALPRIVTPYKSKGDMITSWQADGRFSVVTDDGTKFDAASITLVDDKAASFKGLPFFCDGLLLQRPGETKLASQAGEVPINVRTIGSLDEVAK